MLHFQVNPNTSPLQCYKWQTSYVYHVTIKFCGNVTSYFLICFLNMNQVSSFILSCHHVSYSLHFILESTIACWRNSLPFPSLSLPQWATDICVSVTGSGLMCIARSNSYEAMQIFESSSLALYYIYLLLVLFMLSLHFALKGYCIYLTWLITWLLGLDLGVTIVPFTMSVELFV